MNKLLQLKLLTMLLITNALHNCLYKALNLFDQIPKW